VIAYCITLETKQSQNSARVLQASHERVGNEFELRTFTATGPGAAESLMRWHDIRWTYPWVGEERAVGLVLHAYATKNRKARMACFMSHFRLWVRATEHPVLIMEDDAIFIRKFDPDPLLTSPFDVIGINDPRGATRKASVFHAAVQRQDRDICAVPWVDSPEIPQGLAGASAYLMRPEGALSAITATRTLGAWPNDALLCKQLIDGLGTTKTYYTTVQRTRSTLA